ncbi:MAG: type I glutamate--ammonia ligase [Bacillota bacterium]
MFTSLDQLLAYCRESGIEIADFKIVDVAGRWHHLSIPISRLSAKTLEAGIGFDGSSYGFLTVEKSDMVFIPDISTAVIDPFYEHRTISMIGDIYTLGDAIKRYESDPRFIAEKAETYMRETGVADEYRILPEFEFYLFDQVAYRVQPNHMEFLVDTEEAEWNSGDKERFNAGYKVPHKGGYHLALPHDNSSDLRSEMTLTLERMGVSMKYHHHEVGGPGQMELEVEPGPMKEMADKTVLIKYVVKNLALVHGRTATFMPKPLFGEAGNGMHVHMQLFKEGRPLFYDSAGYAGLSQTAMYYIGGLLKHAPALLALTNPSTNSYKRLVPGYEAPISICFGVANRSSVIRIPAYANQPEEKRFEFRSSDATCNPYLAYSAMLLAGLDGIRRRIDPVAEGFGPLDANIFELSDDERAKIGALPKSLDEAAQALERDHEFLLEGGVFSRAFLGNWLKRIRQEAARVSLLPHPEEYRLYYDV